MRNLQQKAEEGLAVAESLTWWIVRGGAIPFEVFLHEGMGAAYPGLAGLLSFVQMFLLSMVCAGEGMDVGPVFLFGMIYLGMLVVRRLEYALITCRRKPQPHSGYDGWPLLCSVFPGISPQAAKRVIEPLLVGGSGLALLHVNQPLGLWFLFGAVSLTVTHEMVEQSLEADVQALNDQALYQQEVAERFLRSREDSF